MDGQRDSELKKVAEQAAAEAVLRVAANAAEQVALTATHVARALSEVTKVDLGYIKKELEEIKLRLDNKYVTIDVFQPIKNVVYGQVALILIAVVGGLLAMIMKKG